MSCPEVAVIADVALDDRTWLEVADVVVGPRQPVPPQWIEQTFRRYPGTAIAVVADVLALRDGRQVTIGAGGHAVLVAAFLHGWLAAGNPVEELDGVVVHFGRRRGSGCAVRLRVGRWDGGD